METITCKLCSTASHLRLQVKEYLQHIKLFHAHQPDFKITCGISGCQRTFINFGTFCDHVYDVHSDSTSTTEPFEVDSVNEISVDCNEDHIINDGYTSNDDDDDHSAALDGCNDNDQPCCSTQDMLKRSAAMTLLGLKEKFKLTQASLQGVIQSMTALTQQNMSILKSKVVAKHYLLYVIIVLFRFMEFCQKFLIWKCRNLKSVLSRMNTLCRS